MTAGALLCVYYKIDSRLHAEIAPRVRQLQAQLVAAWPDLQAEVLQRPDATTQDWLQIETWMETYRHAGLGPALIDAIHTAATQAGLPTPRHVESFVPLR
jgi:Domain of unknown function (DUF4936)